MQIEKETPQFVPMPLAPEKQKELEVLLETERKARQDSNMDISQTTCRKILNLLIDNNDPVRLISVVKTLATKRGQIIRSTTELVRGCMAYVDRIPDEALKIHFVTELKNVCDKKIFVEVEYARLAMILVKHNERKGANLEEAARIMENVQVETYSSMTKQEKIEFILYQMHLQFILGDPIRLIIVSKKINPKMLNESGFHLFKVTYFLYLYYLNMQQKDWLQCSENLERVLEGLTLTPDLSTLSTIDPILLERYPHYLDKGTAAEGVLFFAALAEHNESKIEHLRKLKAKYDGYLSTSSRMKVTIESFLSKEITSSRLDVAHLRSFPALSAAAESVDTLFLQLGSQLIKKNLVIIASYFKNIRLRRLAEILEAPVEQVEDDLCDLIVSGFVKAKIDRPSGIVHFVLAEVSNDVDMVDSWIQNINEIVDIVDLACERIDHEDIVVK
jgi:26S proteasome regulatory subunit N5